MTRLIFIIYSETEGNAIWQSNVTSQKGFGFRYEIAKVRNYHGLELEINGNTESRKSSNRNVLFSIKGEI